VANKKKSSFYDLNHFIGLCIQVVLIKEVTNMKYKFLLYFCWDINIKKGVFYEHTAGVSVKIEITTAYYIKIFKTTVNIGWIQPLVLYKRVDNKACQRRIYLNQ